MDEHERMPEVLAMILCDQVIRDVGTGKVTVVGSFSSVTADAFPTYHPHMAVYVALTDGEGDYAGRLRFVHAETEEELMHTDGAFALSDPLQVAELQFNIPALPLPHAGKYRMDFFCDGQLLKSRWFQARQAPESDAS